MFSTYSKAIFTGLTQSCIDEQASSDIACGSNPHFLIGLHDILHWEVVHRLVNLTDTTKATTATTAKTEAQSLDRDVGQENAEEEVERRDYPQALDAPAELEDVAAHAEAAAGRGGKAAVEPGSFIQGAAEEV